MTTEPNPHSEEEGVSFKELILNLQDWLNYLWSRWKFLLAAGVIGGICGLGYAFWKKPVYTATTTFVLESPESKGGLSRLAGMAAVVGIDLGNNGGGLFQGDNILQLYKSRRMLEQTLLSRTHPSSKELLIERFIDFNDIAWEPQSALNSLDFRVDPESLDGTTRRLRDSVITAFTNAINNDILTVEKLDKNLSIIKVDVKSADEIFSKSFNENLVKNVNNFYILTTTKRSAENVAILQAKVDSVRAVMSGAIYSAARVSDATPNLNPTRQVQRAAPTQEAQFSAEANRAVLTQLLQNLELTKMTLLQEQPLIQLVDQPVYPLKMDRVSKLKGIIIGGLVAGFLTLLWLVVSRYLRDIVNQG